MTCAALAFFLIGDSIVNNFDDEDNYDEAFDDIPQDNPEANYRI